MEIISTTVMAKDEKMVTLTIALSEGEQIKKGDELELAQMDGGTITRKVLCVNQWCYKDIEDVCTCTYCTEEDGNLPVIGPCRAELTFYDVDTHALDSEENRATQEFLRLFQETTCITPYRELQMGSQSIYDNIQEGYTVPERVILYLQTKRLFTMALGVYAHPFKKDVDLLGPYMYTDGIYYWDRDTWKYVVKYGLKLPEDFIVHVMSEEGEAFLKSMSGKDSWQEQLEELKQQKNTLCLLPDDAGDSSLEAF
ncbi:MAG: hypothetical protein K1W16_14180 [Lachnospiraceae bacterium]